MALLTISGDPETVRAVEQLLPAEPASDLRVALLGPGTNIDPAQFDLVLNMKSLSLSQAVEILRAACQTAEPAKGKQIPFSHESERMFADLLDFYRIQWEYEPRTFPLQWDKDGKVTEAFTPDFYLPELDLYVEVTAMKQALTTRKNRKMKRLRAIYPHIAVQILYQKDVQDLAFKHAH